MSRLLVPGKETDMEQNFDPTPLPFSDSSPDAARAEIMRRFLDRVADWLPANDSDHSRVNLRWQQRCDNWDECASRLDQMARPDWAWTPRAALESAEPGLPEGGLRALLFDRVTGDGAFTRGGLLLPDRWKREPDSDYGVGVAFKHESADEGVMTMKAFVFRRICMNGLIWGGSAASATVEFDRHLDAQEVASLVRCHMDPILEGGESLRAALMQTLHIVLYDPVQFIEREANVLAKDLGVPIESLSPAWRQGLLATANEPEGPSIDSLFAVVNGLTRAAQSFDARTRWLLEEHAGRMVMNPEVSGGPRRFTLGETTLRGEAMEKELWQGVDLPWAQQTREIGVTSDV